MPKVRGQDAIGYFRSQFPSVPVIVLTGENDARGAADLFQQGITEYLVKPVQPDKLTAAVAKAAKDHVLFKDQFRT
ncbi:MAG: response regulator [Nitrospirae bacterium]|nr:response regulator [Nitrospirota bacterium]